MNSQHETNYQLKGEKQIIQYVRTYELMFPLQKDCYFEDRVELMKFLMDDIMSPNNGHVCHDDKNLFINFTILEKEYEYFCKKYIKPLYGDRFTVTSIIHDVVRDDR